MLVSSMPRGESRGVLSFSLVAMMLIAMLSGCSRGGVGSKPTAKVSGEVTYDGKPVTGGMLTFSPIGDDSGKMTGRAGQAVIGDDGSYTVTTYTDNDGAVIGPHRLIFAAPAVVTRETPAGAHAKPETSPYAGLTPKEVEIEVSSGTNTIDIELVKPVQAVKTNVTAPGAVAHGQSGPAAHAQYR